MRGRLGERGKSVARRLRARVAPPGARTRVRPELVALRERVAVLEGEVTECRQLNLRLAELTDVVQELLLPISQRDQERVDEILHSYRKGV